MDTTFVEDSHDPLHIFVESLSSPQRQPDQSDPYSFSDEEQSDLVIALEAVHIGSTPAAQGSCSPMDMASLVQENLMSISQRALITLRLPQLQKRFQKSPLGEEFTCLPSQELVLLPPNAASFPAPQLKNVQRLRTIHYV